ncbi:MAG TPA: CocE/NonD family hydrolase [Archangium sp.]|uniref:CocE/NonD family hydrolase n=1 Tax=Archangium sp. TaxID=1872627 RepID=UPI002E32D534|nr:CocE/NonD family hydrolase [Archangium sp.]HEX5748203.1 CocE/NonD family hydrolase [Archangium sp.]
MPLAPLVASLALLSTLATAPAPSGGPPDLPSDTPATFTPAGQLLDHERRTVDIPMRDGVKLHTIILVPRGAKNRPMLLTRTPYDAERLTRHAESTHLSRVLHGYDNATDVIVEGGYIRVLQDVRGKYGSEGDYVMNRPLHGPRNPTPVDHATDTYDTIDWLVKNVPESNGRVGIIGISYDGFLPLMALVNPHPALKVAVPMNPMVDGWMGDDWFHHGAFRQTMLPYILEQQATRKGEIKWASGYRDQYDEYLAAGSAGEIGRRHGMEQLGFFRKLLAHPAYDAFWRDQAVDKLLAARPLTVPVMIVHSLWDQEDIYGAPAVYETLEPKDTANDRVFLVMGPWHHGQAIGDGSSLGALEFGADTSAHFRREILRPFLDQYLVEGAPRAQVAPVTAFETGTNRWRELSSWPAGCASGCKVKPAPFYLRPDSSAGFVAPAAGGAAFDEYVSDPARPVPYRARPIVEDSSAAGASATDPWKSWLVRDQREAASRPDVLVYVSDVLTAPVKISGRPMANLVASTSGTDSDWVVKLIDVFPDEVAARPEMGGYQLMVSADIFRGRYRESFEKPRPLPAGKPVTYRFGLPTANHVFLPGHRIMVQIQSSWFPLYDRNPQTYVESIFDAKPGDFRKAVQRVYHAPGQASFVELPLVMPQEAREERSPAPTGR